MSHDALAIPVTMLIIVIRMIIEVKEEKEKIRKFFSVDDNGDGDDNNVIAVVNGNE